MPGLAPGIPIKWLVTALSVETAGTIGERSETPFFERLWASEASPFFERLCPAMTVQSDNDRKTVAAAKNSAYR
jgi:hypothetical protein